MAADIILPTTALAPVASRIPTLTNLDADEIDGVIRLAENAKSANTRLAYGSDWRQFSDWMQARGAEPLPAPVDLVCAYVAFLGTRLRPSSIGRHIASIAWHHRRAGYDPGPTASSALREVMKGLRRELGTAPNPKSPLTADLLLRLLATCTDPTKGTRDKALLAVAFSAALRRSEVVAIDVEHLSWNDQGVTLLIPRSKGDQEGKGQMVAIPHGIYIKPTELIQNWLTISGISTGALFRPINRGGRIGAERLGDDAFVRMLKARTQAAGIDARDYSGHSCRSGYVTTAVDADAPLLKITEVTRHKSLDMLQVYSRRSNLYSDHSGRTFL